MLDSPVCLSIGNPGANIETGNQLNLDGDRDEGVWGAAAESSAPIPPTIKVGIRVTLVFSRMSCEI